LSGRSGACTSVRSVSGTYGIGIFKCVRWTAFSHREGIALSTITYNDDGEIRPIFYRLSLAEMVVPYGAPEHPHPRKFAFDA
jgi:Cu2+-containing amine oxidase